ncbi:MAG: hypothetical protein HPY65_07845 [Syntrophaceae bacterium]|nr:hypothetical protein [Syntrophaceae bacterium]
MSPEHVSALSSLADIISKIGTWPIEVIIAVVVLGPWVMMYLVSRSIEKRHNAAVQMYESNVKLVQHYEKIASEHVDTIRLSTAATTELTTYLKNRIPCHERIAERFGK